MYVGPGNFYKEGTYKDLRVTHFWIESKEYDIKNINRGDKILIYVSIGDGGRMMGPSVYGKREYLTWATFGGMIGVTSCGNAYLSDATPIGLPISSKDIVCVEKGTGIDLIKSIMCKYAIEYGGFHLKNYVDEFGSIPLKKGDQIKPGYNYAKENIKLGLRSSHKVLQTDDYLVVKSVGLNKTAFLAINSVSLKQMT